MPPVVVPSDAPQAFKDAKSLEAWYRKHHATAAELWLLVGKKDAGVASVSAADALDIALCWGWIDAIRKPYDATYFLQRYTRRKPRSIWSARNREHIDRLIAAGRMQKPGLAEVEAAKADGRWERAYQGSAKMEFPPDLLAAIEAEPAALELFNTLNAQNRFAMAFRTHNMKTVEGRAKKIATLVEMLKRGETIYPNGKKK